MNKNGFRFGGLNITDVNGILAGGLGPGKWTSNSLTIADVSIDLEKRYGWDGGLFGTEFLYYTGGGPGYSIDGVPQGKNSPNALAGTVMGFESLDVVPLLSRAELYQLWYRQELLDKKLIVRIGKSVPTYDFNNVVKPIPLNDPQVFIPAISSALFTPLYVNPTMLGGIPGYYNSATGIVAACVPEEHIDLQYGFFDGNLAAGRQTGLEGPHFNGYWLHLAELGANWSIGADKKPGRIGVGGWWQTGKLKTPGGPIVNGADGMYLFGSQRLYFEDRERTNNGLEFYAQFGATDSDLVLTHRYFGTGLSYFGLLPGRAEDSCGFGLAYGLMSDQPNAGSIFFTHPPGTHLRTSSLGSSETILTWYYQWKVNDWVFFQPNLSTVIDPARHPDIPNAFALTLRLIALF